MYYNDFQDLKLSALGFGCMRLPLLENGEINEEMVCDMVRYAADHGINYYDTAYPYHGSKSEIAVGKALKQLPRESFYLATKFPGHQIADSYDPKAVFEEQLEKCGVDYFDFYLLHNVYENSIKTYEDSRWGIIDYFIEQKKNGRIKHLGFSSHALMPTLEYFVEKYGDQMEFCQLQINYLDWTLQDAKQKYEYLTKKGIPVWVMEPLRGGKLVNLGEDAMAKLNSGMEAEKHVEGTNLAIDSAFRFLQSMPNVTMILSGMSHYDQMVENIKIFEERRPLSEKEETVLLDLAEGMKDSVPCTACRYCCDGCPQGLDIPTLLAIYNECRIAPSFNAGMTIDAMDEDQRPSACIGCGACAAVCPQKIDIPEAMSDFAGILDKLPHWADLCKQREEAARKIREEQAKKKNK